MHFKNYRLYYLMAFGLIVTATLFVRCTNSYAKGTYVDVIRTESNLPLPSTMPLDRYEKLLYTFLENRDYEKLGWRKDKSIRNTGPFVNDVAYGTHPAVRIHYSPEVYSWLKGGRKGEIKDGAMIIKVMFAAPAQRYSAMSPDELKNVETDPKSSLFEGWTVMIRDKNGSKDGWFWSYYAPGQERDLLNKYPFSYPLSGFGNYCVRCHASAESEFTFSSLTNIMGEPGDPISYYVDDSWRDDATQQAYNSDHERKATVSKAGTLVPSPVNHDFLNTFPQMGPVARSQVKTFPPETYDHVVSGADGPGQFLTSDQCLSCHSGQTGNFLPNMITEMDKNSIMNVSPYGEWRWSMMGLAGRDPIFFAQLESELAIHDQNDLGADIQNTCFSCHGVMGQRQLALDHPGSKFKLEQIYHTQYDRPEGKYGALARDGISCMSCHQIVDAGLPLDSIQTGRFKISPPGEIQGPFDDPSTYAMNEALGLTPKANDYIKSSRLCASCHTINLPVFNAAGKKIKMHYEQTTYLEWLNSDFQDEYNPYGTEARNCQSCHMPNKFPIEEGPSLAFKIANIQDQDYPMSEHLVASDSITLSVREEYRRHTLLGINVFALEMFNQFDTILGVRKQDYMTGLSNGLPNAIENSNRLAKQHSVKLELLNVDYSQGKLKTTIELTNLTGHRFPSGVGFRRAFIQFAVLNAKNDTIWASGRANDVGVVVDENCNPLPSEFLEYINGVQQYEPHYTTINQQNQVQIYQELAKNPEGEFTTSFVAIDEVVKDNRLLPKGWTSEGPKGLDPVMVKATHPEGKAIDDKFYMSGQGKDRIEYVVPISRDAIQGGRVVATLYYQSIPPFYLKQRFETAKGPNGQRLYYLASHLKTKGTHIEGWKLETGKAVSKNLNF